jgi:glycosyltransferase involved in cell wall biosynthesis
MCQTLQRTEHNAGVADRVHFTGYLGGDDKSSAYRAAMLLAIPSRQEAMSIVVLEAGVTDTAVLLTNECGFNVASQFGGAVVSATIDGIRQGLTEMLADQESLRLRGKLLGDFVRARFSWTSIVHTYMGLYEQLRATP